jgi:hypothetical protein
VQLVTALREGGSRVEVGTQSVSLGLSVRPWILNVDAEQGRVYVFEYDSDTALVNDAAKISSDGFKIGNSFVDWAGSPHFYRNARIIVNYVGCKTDITSKLETLVGPQFAGGGVPPIFGNPCGPAA